MAALRALLFAVFGGFIGAAPAAPVVTGGAGHAGYLDAGSHSQKRETPGYEINAPVTPSRAAAPPCTDAPPTAALVPLASAPRAFPRASAFLCTQRDRTNVCPIEDVRAGLLDLPPPAR